MMSIKRLFSLMIIILIFSVTTVYGKDNSSISKQIIVIVEFYETMTNNAKPRVSDFFKYFSKDNESELDLILRQQFPSLDRKRNWFSDQKAFDYVNMIYQNPAKYTSRFLECLRNNKPEIFFNKIKRQIEFPPDIKDDFRYFEILVGRKKIIFQFSKEETTIENIYLPDGKSIYDSSLCQ